MPYELKKTGKLNLKNNISFSYFIHWFTHSLIYSSIHYILTIYYFYWMFVILGEVVTFVLKECAVFADAHWNPV